MVSKQPGKSVGKRFIVSVGVIIPTVWIFRRKGVGHVGGLHRNMVTEIEVAHQTQDKITVQALNVLFGQSL